MVCAVYHRDKPLEGRDMLLVVRFSFLRFRVGVRVGGVFDVTRTVHGREVRVWGWNYRTLRGHFEMGEMNYELWKWRDTGDVEFRTRGVGPPGSLRNPFVGIGFRVFGPRQRERFYDAACRRMVELTCARLEQRPPDDVPSAAESIAGLQEARDAWQAAWQQVRRTAPTVGPSAALVRFSSPFQLHPLSAQMWSRRLAPRPVIAANDGYIRDA